VDGVALEFDYSGESLTVYPAEPLSFDQEFIIVIDYSGTPISGLYFGDDEIATFTEPSDSRYWYPCWDHPADKADSVSIHVTVPEDWEVVANGLLRGINSNGDGTNTHNWYSKYPISTYLIAFASAHNYSVINLEYETQEGDTMPMPHFVFDWQEDIGEISFATMPEMVGIEAELFGPDEIIAYKIIIRKSIITFRVISLIERQL
jgi:aminopeptidase N